MGALGEANGVNFQLWARLKRRFDPSLAEALPRLCPDFDWPSLAEALARSRARLGPSLARAWPGFGPDFARLGFSWLGLRPCACILTRLGVILAHDRFRKKTKKKKIEKKISKNQRFFYRFV